MKIPSLKRAARRAAFTLIEMLAVLIIMSILIAVVTPGLLGIINSTRMSAAGDSLINYINLAQQEAVATNVPTEIRFYKFADETDIGSESLVRAYQVVRLGGLDSTQPLQDQDGNYVGVEAVTEPLVMDGSLAIADSDSLSPVMDTFFNEGQTLFNRSNAQYAAMRFYPDGSFRIPTDGGGSEVGVVSTPLDESYLTITDSSKVDEAGENLKNYYCIQIDPFTGKSRVYRP